MAQDRTTRQAVTGVAPMTDGVTNGVLYALAVLVWGSTWLAIEFQLGSVAPEVSVFYRYVLAATLLMAWCRARGSLRRMPASAHLHFMLLGLTLFSVNYVLAYRAQIHLSSALAAIAFATMLWLNMLNARLFFGTRTEPRALFGSVLGIAGLVTVFYPRINDLSVSDATLTGSMLALAGALLASLGNMVSVSAQRRGLPVVVANAWGMAYGAAFSGIFAWLSGAAFTFDTSPGYIVSLLYLAVFGSIIAFGAYLTLLGRVGAHRAGYAVVAFPVVAVILSVAFEGLAVTWTLFAGIVLVLGGNVFVLRARREPLPAADMAMTPVEKPGSAP